MIFLRSLSLVLESCGVQRVKDWTDCVTFILNEKKMNVVSTEQQVLIYPGIFTGCSDCVQGA